MVYIKYCYDNEIKEDEMGRACGTGEAINAYTFLLEDQVTCCCESPHIPYTKLREPSQGHHPHCQCYLGLCHKYTYISN